MQFIIDFEAAGFIYAVVICIIHRTTRKDEKYPSIFFHRTLIINAVMTGMDVLTGILLSNYQRVHPLVNQLLNTVFYILALWMVYAVTRYGDSLSDPDTDSPRSWFIAKAVFSIALVLLLANIVWGEKLFFYVDSQGYHYSPFFFGSFIGPGILAVIFAVRLMKAQKEQVKRKRMFIISGTFLTIAATVLELISGKNTMIFGLCTTTLMTVILMNLEIPEYTRLTQTIRNYNNELEREAEIRTRQITDARNNLIYGIAQFIEEKNSAPGHLKRTCSIAEIMTEEMRRNTDDVRMFSLFENMTIAAPLHELGRLNIPPSMANKYENYTRKELETLSERTRNGASIVRNILSECNDKDLTKTAENMVLYKNENYDGTGYPDGLQRDQIPLEARIIALADEIDRLVGCGTSQNEAAVEKAVTAIEEKMGTRFDPRLIGTLEAVRGSIKDFYKEEMPQKNRVQF